MLNDYDYDCRASVGDIYEQLCWHVRVSFSPLPVLCLVLSHLTIPPLVLFYAVYSEVRAYMVLCVELICLGTTMNSLVL